MKNCVNCGLELRDNEYFCTGCGSYQPDERSLDFNKYEVHDEIERKNKYTSGYFVEEEKNYEIDMSKDEAIDSFSKPTYNSTDTYIPLACNDDLANNPKRNRRTKSHMGTFGKVLCVIVIIVAIFWAKDRFLGSSEKTAEGFMDALCAFESDKVLEYCLDSGEDSEEAKDLKKMFSEIGKLELQYDVSYQIKSTDELSSLEKKDFWKNITTEIMFTNEENDDLKEFVIYKVNVTSKDLSKGTTENIEVELYVGKFKGKWKVIGMDKKE